MTQQELKDLLHYDQDTGIFTWLISRGSIKSGKKINNSIFDYTNIKINKKSYRAHRLAWLYIYGYIPINQIDHINGNKSDNRLCNLREVTNQQNQFNSPIRKDNKSGVKGVHWHKKQNKWVANLHINGKAKQLGSFDNLEEAKKVINEARLLHHGEFSREK
jgi:hypothetical protein